jgi:hypothetical protein
MRPPQLELWSAEPHQTPGVYQQLTPEQRRQLIRHLAQLILKLVPVPPHPSPATENHNHER